jgi:dTDP-glucose 4,6-dehydratase
VGPQVTGARAEPARDAPRHILVTGGAGFIGSSFVRFVLGARPGVRVTTLDALTYSGNPDNLSGLADEPRHRFIHGDILDAGLVDRLLAECDGVVHMAAESHVDRSIIDAGPFVRTNVLGTQVLLDGLRRATKAGRTAPRFVQVSTDEVYGSLPTGRPDLRFREECPLAPSSPYAASKAAGDCLTLACFRTYGLPVVITRCSNNLGPRQFPEKVIPRFVTNLLAGRRLPVYGDGLHVRDWIHVDDHCEGVLAALERGRAGEVYNIGAGNERTNLELARTIARIMGRGEEMIEFVADRPGHDRRYAVDASKIMAELGWRATRSAWPEALERTVRWYIENEAWWRRVLSGAYRAAPCRADA